jgi:hypothetical protein
VTESETSFTAIVTDIRLESRVKGASRWQMALDRTLFSSTLQRGVLIAVAPSGARLEVPVLAVFEEDGVVWHRVDKPLTEGTKVSGLILDARLRTLA